MSLEHEKLDAYQVARELYRETSLLNRQCKSRELRDQLERASLSILLNVAEGAGRRAAPDKRRFYAIARGSAAECGALLDALAIRGFIAPAEHRRANQLVVRVVQMLSRLSPIPP